MNDVEEYFRQEFEKAFEESGIPTYEIVGSTITIKSENYYITTNASMFFKSVEKVAQEILNKSDHEQESNCKRYLKNRKRNWVGLPHFWQYIVSSRLIHSKWNKEKMYLHNLQEILILLPHTTSTRNNFLKGLLI